jgi:hypothetical protein
VEALLKRGLIRESEGSPDEDLSSAVDPEVDLTEKGGEFYSEF